MASFYFVHLFVIQLLYLFTHFLYENNSIRARASKLIGNKEQIKNKLRLKQCI